MKEKGEGRKKGERKEKEGKVQRINGQHIGVSSIIGDQQQVERERERERAK